MIPKTPSPDTTDDDLEQHPDDLALARQVRQNRPELPAAKVSQIERTVVQHFNHQKRQAPRPQYRSGLQWALALALALMLVIGATGAVTASESSLPGQPLYTLKRLTETLRLTLTPVAEQPSLHADLAEERLEELEALTAQGRVTAELLNDLATETELAVTGAESLSGSDSADLLERLVRLTQRQQALLERIEANVPEPARAALEHARDVSVKGLERAQAAIQKLDSPPAPITPPGQDQASTSTATDALDLTQTPGPTQTPRPTNDNVPGSDQTPPGQGHTPPGQVKTPPGQVKTPPGQAHTPPGQVHTPPGQVKTPPGQGGGGGNDGGGGGGGNGNGNGGGKP